MLNCWSRGKLIIVGCTVLFVLSLIDGSLTFMGLGQGAIEEGNPVMQWFIEKSPITFMAIKLSLPVMLGFVLWKRQDRSSKFVTCFLGLLLVVYSVVIFLNIYRVLIYDI